MVNFTYFDITNLTFFFLVFSWLLVTLVVNVALVVGAAFAFVNHGDKILTVTLTNKHTVQLLRLLIPSISESRIALCRGKFVTESLAATRFPSSRILI